MLYQMFRKNKIKDGIIDRVLPRRIKKSNSLSRGSNRHFKPAVDVTSTSADMGIFFFIMSINIVLNECPPLFLSFIKLVLFMNTVNRKFRNGFSEAHLIVFKISPISLSGWDM